MITHGSTFSGIGAPEIAAEMLGWANVFHCEINPFGRAVLDYHFPNAESYEDITKTDFSKWRGRITVLTGGFPCQPFSYAGKRRGAEDDRYLWPYMLKCIEQVRPAWFVGENVAGIGTMVFPGESVKVGEHADLFGEGDGYDIYKKRERYVLAEIIGQLENIGYSVQPFVIPACAVGAPHRRDRVFIVAHADGPGQPTPDKQSRRDRTPLDGRRESISFDGVSGFGPSQPFAHAPNLQRDGGVPGDGTNGQPCSAEPGGCDCSEDRGGLFANTCEFENRWRTFPTVAPVYRGNDGLPFDVDDLTISFTKWKTESLKAYGNAIVPQIMYEIFRAIDAIETQKQ